MQTFAQAFLLFILGVKTFAQIFLFSFFFRLPIEAALKNENYC